MPPNDHDPQDRFASYHMKETAFSAAIGAAMMMFVGFYLNYQGIGDSRIYNLSVDGFTWMMKGGGGLMGLVAVLLWAGIRPMLMVDALLAMGVGGLMIVIGVIWLGNQDMEGILLLLFGLVFISSGWRSWLAYGGLPGAQRLREDVQLDTTDAPPPVVAADPAARQAAMERLLAAKRHEVPPESVAAQGDSMAREPVTEQIPAARKRSSPAKETGEEIAPAQVPAAVRPTAPDEPAPEGFLAELGREDAKRK